ncbi:hypothetical protein RN001_006866 [Aquatica leii]|uniref:Beta-1,4-glucuronyltransferase 1 n=1 Tax=Aquatica leii TaxID=1421715 RepID=A0AAN7SIU0_9COLE|nr:hypothetical protein RN001_006866 [Aquatica leii]
MFTPAKIILKTTPDKEEPNLIQKITNCTDRPLEPSIEQRGEYWVLFNYVLASKRYKCYESITYTTQGDYTFLDNIIPLVERWKGPISLALHAPGYDFLNTLSSIAYLRNCLKSSHLVKKFVTFHIFFPTNHIPLYSSFKDHEFFLKNMYEDDIDCYKIAPYAKDDYKSLYKTKEKLIYPINVARNIARTNAQTHFVLASDIELYPSLNLIPKFLRMVQRQKQLFEDRQPKVFVLPVFEVLLNESVPNNKTVLQTMVKERKAFYFHKRICAPCHSIPNETKWINTNETKNLNVFTKTKREGFYRKWEAFYIGTHEEPLFDERLSWEGQSNKMSQAYAMCLMNYDYVVLDNAFLAHKPGIKKHRIQKYRYSSFIAKTRTIIKDYIKPQLQHVYGDNERCIL